MVENNAELSQLTGIAAILKFEVPKLQEIEQNANYYLDDSDSTTDSSSISSSLSSGR